MLPLSDQGDALPPYPEPAPGTNRLNDPETIAAGLRYWSAVEKLALRQGDTRLGRIAGGLRRSYEQARDRLKDAGMP